MSDYPEGPAPQIRKKKSLFDIVKEHVQSKPATQKDIDQLKLDREKAILKKDIAKANAERKNLKGSALNTLFGSNEKPTRTRKTKKQKKQRATRRSQSSDDGGLSKMIGNNNSNKYKGLTG